MVYYGAVKPRQGDFMDDDGDDGNTESQEFMSKLNRDSAYRIAALHGAVRRAGQDGGLNNDSVDVISFAELYYGWLKGDSETEKPLLEKIRGNSGKGDTNHDNGQGITG